MAYTPPTIPIEADFTETPYTPPVIPIEADFTDPGINLTPLQGSVTTAGQIPTVTHGHNNTALLGSITVAGDTPTVTHGCVISPIQGSIITAGQQPRDTITPLQGSIATAGQIPSVIQGYSESPIQGSVVVAGEIPSLILGYSESPIQGSITVTGDTPIFSGDVPKIGTVVVSGGIPSVTHGCSIVPLQGTIAVVGRRPGAVLETPLQGSITVAGDIPGDIVEIIVVPETSGYRIECTLTGAADSLSDIIIPVSSLVKRFTSDLRSVLTIVVPSGIDFAADISARSNGGIVIDTITTFTDGSETTFTNTEHPIETIRSDQGAISYSVTISAGLTLPDQNRKRIFLTDESYRSNQANGLIRARTTLEDQLFVGDTAVLPDDTELLVDNIVQVFNASSRYMEVVGA